MNSEKVRAHIYVNGVVQGVFFRSHTKSLANKLNLKGWVRNLPDGRVEILAEGDKDSVNKLIQWCYRGPIGARVDNVEYRFEPYKGEFKNFLIIY
ncbi:MAG: acylphosphatase [Nitrososphaerales archaeon]